MIITICLLAAGESNRFNGEKLLSSYGNISLSEHVLELINTLKSDDSKQLYKIVITKEQLFDFFKSKVTLEWQVINNEIYQKGMSTSIKLGVLEAVKNKSDYLLLFLADMPLIKKQTVDNVLKHMLLPLPKIIRPYYSKKPGFPVALPRMIFSELKHLTGDVGAKSVIKAHRDILLKLPCNDPGSIFDIDVDIRSID